MRSDASWSKPFVLPDRDCVTTLQPDVTDVLIIIATICCSATSDRPFERNWIRSKLPPLLIFVSFSFVARQPSYSVLDLQRGIGDIGGRGCYTADLFLMPTTTTTYNHIIITITTTTYLPTVQHWDATAENISLLNSALAALNWNHVHRALVLHREATTEHFL